MVICHPIPQIVRIKGFKRAGIPGGKNKELAGDTRNEELDEEDGESRAWIASPEAAVVAALATVLLYHHQSTSVLLSYPIIINHLFC